MTSDGALLPRDDGILAACLFSFLLHLPVLVGLGVYFGGEESRAIGDITAIIESAAGAMRPLEAAEVVPMPGGEADTEPVARDLLGERPLPRLPRLPLAERDTAFEEPFEGPPEKAEVPRVSLTALTVRDRSASRRWIGWYSGEIRRRIKDAFPCRLLVDKGITGRVRFRISLRPDGSVEKFDVIQAEHAGLIEAAGIAVKDASPFPAYASLGLDYFPPFDLTVNVVE